MAKVKLPKKGEITEWVRPFVVDGDLSKYENSNQTNQTNQPNVTNINVQNLSGFIYVPSVNLYVAKDRTLQGKNWHDCHAELQNNNYRMPTIKEFAEFLRYLKSNRNGVQNASSIEISNILDEILTVRYPWRAGWLDAKFEKKNDKMYINYGHEIQKDGTLKLGYSEQLEDYLTEDKLPGINLDDWINNSSKHGLPRSKVIEGELYYWSPKENCVARFGADSNRAILDCYWDPVDRDAGLGVFACAEGVAQKI